MNNEIKAKVFAQYLGQKVKPNNDNIIGTLITIHESRINLLVDIPHMICLGHWGFDKCKLILKPLSAITDEDALEVGRILGSQLDKEYWKETIKSDIDQISRYDLPYFTLIEVYQYLQSKGYDLPNYLLGGKTLQEAGLAIYENPELLG